MISVLMPYWERPKSLQRQREIFEEFYPDVEVVVVDDGSPEYPARNVCVGWDQCSLYEMPIKDHSLNPCVPWNVARSLASGDVLVLNGPEIHHDRPVLSEMEERLVELGPQGYVLACCWDNETKTWYQHPAHRDARYHFCSMMHASLWDKIGGFDEEYRDGYCFDDDDFLRRIESVGAEVVTDQRVVVKHNMLDRPVKPRNHDRELLRNKELYRSKWIVP